jgi:hypothetical protein
MAIERKPIGSFVSNGGTDDKMFTDGSAGDGTSIMNAVPRKNTSADLL